MNLARPSLHFISYAFNFSRALLRVLPKQKCQTFGIQAAKDRPRIEKLYVINLEREPGRWSKMQKELRQILDTSGEVLLNLTERSIAVDAKSFLGDPSKDADIDPIYTLGDQLFVEPQPLVSPTNFELNSPIRMSRPEIAVARSHINLWRQIATGDHAYAIILEDDAWFHNGFAKNLDQAWSEVIDERENFDILYLAYHEVKNGAPKTFLSNNVFRPMRGLWHLSGYILSREGAEKLLRMLPCRGPIDLWINHQFKTLDVRAIRQPIISQRRDTKSTNTYSILPSLTRIGVINSESASLFNTQEIEQPVFAFGPEGTGLTALAMALSMLGYRCCSDLEVLPEPELERLLEGRKGHIFNAYVNIGSLNSSAKKLRSLYPKAKFFITAANCIASDDTFAIIRRDLSGADIAVLHAEIPNRWQAVCEHLKCAPPTCSFPNLTDIGRRSTLQEITGENQHPKHKKPKRDKSPWVVEPRKWWQGIRAVAKEDGQSRRAAHVRFNDCLDYLDARRWILRSDTFTDNLAMFCPSNVELKLGIGAQLCVRSEPLGVRDYSAASICSRDQYLFGKFEATIKASNVPGIITGFFLHRDSPRQEIDIEIAGHRPNQLIANVFYNPGDEGANFDYGYRGAPSIIDLGFDASKTSHRYTIEWSPCEIIWRVDGHLVHRRVIWEPTPIPHLPMTLHINSWPSCSIQLAGKINKRQLPSSTILRSVDLYANFSASKPMSIIDSTK